MERERRGEGEGDEEMKRELHDWTGDDACFHCGLKGVLKVEHAKKLTLRLNSVGRFLTVYVKIINHLWSLLLGCNSLIYLMTQGRLSQSYPMNTEQVRYDRCRGSESAEFPHAAQYTA